MQINQLNVGNYAQPCFATIAPDAPAEIAMSVMQKLGFYYLPVQRGNRVVGLLSQSLVRAALAIHPKSALPVSDLMLRKPAVVAPDTSLYEVLDETPDAAGGVTLVQNSAGEVVGLFTAREAINAFRSLLKDIRGASDILVA
jgi:predicted transcriptional regulator